MSKGEIVDQISNFGNWVSSYLTIFTIYADHIVEAEQIMNSIGVEW